MNRTSKSLKTLTVAQLIERLQDEAPDALVIFGCDYGDYSHTEQALPITGAIEPVTVVESAYSRSGFAIPADDDDAGDDGSFNGRDFFVVLR